MPSRSRTRSVRVNSAVGARKPDHASTAGWSHSSVPSSTYVATSGEDIDFVVDATRKCVSLVTRPRGPEEPRTPNGRRCSTRSPATTATAAPARRWRRNSVLTARSNHAQPSASAPSVAAPAAGVGTVIRPAVTAVAPNPRNTDRRLTSAMTQALPGHAPDDRTIIHPRPGFRNA